MSPRRSRPHPRVMDGMAVGAVSAAVRNGFTPAAVPKPSLSVTSAGTATATPSRVQLLLRRGRAVLLHTMWPHDRSVWLCLRSPGWWLLQLCGLLPVVGHWFWLVLALAVDKQDEYQLCNFIVALRCSHFFTLGVCAALVGCIQAFRCAATASMPCQTLAPKLSAFSACFWVVTAGGRGTIFKSAGGSNMYT